MKKKPSPAFKEAFQMSLDYAKVQAYEKVCGESGINYFKRVGYFKWIYNRASKYRREVLGIKTMVEIKCMKCRVQ